MSLTITTVDNETGDTATATIEAGNYTIICAEPCHLANVQNHANGTTVLTIKGRAAGLMGVKDITAPGGSGSEEKQ